jgi:hypothetical protein
MNMDSTHIGLVKIVKILFWLALMVTKKKKKKNSTSCRHLTKNIAQQCIN